MVDPDFAPIFPCIQLVLDIDDQAVQRLIASINSGSAPVQGYSSLGHPSVVSRIDNERLFRLLVALKDAELGDLVIINSLSLLASLCESDPLPILFVNFAKEILTRLVFSHSVPNRPAWDHELGILAKACLHGEEGAEAAKIIATNLFKGILDYSIVGYLDHPRLMNSLATCHPTIFLDIFLGSSPERSEEISRTFDSESWHDDPDYRYNTLDLIENETLLEWCEKGPVHRFAALAQAVQLCCSTPNEAGRADLSWSPLALELLSRAPKAEDVLHAFWAVFFPQSWTGSRVDAIVKRLPLLDALEQHLDPSVATWASTKRTELTHYAAELRAKEEQEDSLMSQRFE